MIRINTSTLEASREAIPANLKGLSSHTLNNLQTELNPVPTDLINIEYWNENHINQALTATQKFGLEVLTANTAARSVDVSYSILDKTAEDLASDAAQAQAAIESLASEARTERNRLLAATDWVVLRAKELGQPVPLDVYTYRGDLRQLPEQAGFPATITWPEEI